MIINQLVEILLSAHISRGTERINHIRKFQEIVWNDKSVEDESLNNFLSTLAYDFDFYEPNKAIKNEDLSYYGDERLIEEIKMGLEKLKKYKGGNVPE
jgi:hypothetical protein